MGILTSRQAAQFVEQTERMSLIIGVTEESAGARVRVDGWLEGAGVAEFARVLESAPKPVRLMLHELRGADALGISLLRGMADLGTPLEGLSTYLKLVLADGGARAPRPSAAVTCPETPVGSKNT
jgi:hypothetical protein